MRQNRILWLALLAICNSVFLFSQNSSYYAHDMLMAVREESLDKKCNIIQLAGGIIIRECDNNTGEYAINDHLGSIRVVIDDKLANKVSCDYDAYGNISSDVPQGLKEQCRYTKTYKWSNTTQMYYSPTRAYQPTAKRFMSRDMLQYNFSPYIYTNSNPTLFVDKYGTAPVTYDDVYRNVLYYKLSLEQEKMMGHPDLPPARQESDGSSSRFRIDPDSYATLKQIKSGNAFAGVLNYATGDIYLSPVARRQGGEFWEGSDFEGEIKMLGRTYLQIEHNAIDPIHGKPVTSHMQLAQRVDEALGNIPAAGISYKGTIEPDKYMGFGLRLEKNQSQITMTLRSRSLNNFHLHREVNVADADELLYVTKLREWGFSTLNIDIIDIPNEDPRLQDFCKLFNEYIEKNTGLRFYWSYQGLPALADPNATFEELLNRATVEAPRIEGDRIYHNQFVYDTETMSTTGFLNKSYTDALLDFFSKLQLPTAVSRVPSF